MKAFAADVVVIGGGPAGAATAFHAARAGMSVTVVDKATFPRAKTCGDLLSPRALAAIARMGLADADLPGPSPQALRVHHAADRLPVPSNLSLDATALRLSWQSRGKVVERAVLDSLLLDRAVGAGARALNGKAVRIVRDTRGSVCVVVVDACGRRVELCASTVVCATGAAGIPGVLQACRPSRPLDADRARRRVCAVAARTYLDAPDWQSEDLHIYVPVLPSLDDVCGYSWVFPSGSGRLNVGSGVAVTSVHPAPDPKRLLARFLGWLRTREKSTRNAALCAPVEAAAIPLQMHRATADGVLLVGDCAGLANPMTAEGIAAALESGELAAQALASGAPAEAAPAYERLVAARCARTLRLQREPGRLYQSPDLLLGRGIDTLVCEHGATGRAFWRAVFDAAPPQDAPLAIAASPCERATISSMDVELCARVRDTIVASFDGDGRGNPLVGEVVRELVSPADERFGWHTSLATALWQAAVSGRAHDRAADGMVSDGHALNELAPPLPPDRVAVLVLTEMLDLGLRLQEEIAEGADAYHEFRGRKTLALVIADVLNARILASMYALPCGQARAIARIARECFSHAAARCAHDAIRHAHDASRPARGDVPVVEIGSGLQRLFELGAGFGVGVGAGTGRACRERAPAWLAPTLALLVACRSHAHRAHADRQPPVECIEPAAGARAARQSNGARSLVRLERCRLRALRAVQAAPPAAAETLTRLIERAVRSTSEPRPWYDLEPDDVAAVSGARRSG